MITEAWAGRITGTNTGNIYFQVLEQRNELFRGTLRINDPDLGVSVYSVEGTFDGTSLKMSGALASAPDDMDGGKISATGNLNERGDIHGDWSSTIGTAGKFWLTPQGVIERPEDEPDQLFTVRHQFGPIEIDKEQLIELADSLQKEFKNRVVVTVSGESEISCYLDKFKERQSTEERATKIKMRAQDPERAHLSRVVLIEFGPNENFVIAESTDEAWAQGMKEIYARQVRRYERTLTARLKRVGVTTGNFLFLGVLIVLPALPTFWQRALLILAMIMIGQSLAAFDRIVMRHATIWMLPRRKSVVGRSALSWAVNLLGATLAAVLAALIGGWVGSWGG